MDLNINKIKSEKSIKDLLEFGIINIDKPSGPTSFWTSQYVKRALNLNKTSHLGTLDPQVTGVLPVALNRACRLNEYLMHRDKTYVGIMQVHKEISKEDLEKEINHFVGKIMQLPPVKSRVKRELREREVKTFKILEIDNKEVLFESQVQAGTYIRKLCMHPQTQILTKEGLIDISNIGLNSIIYSLNNGKIVEKSISAVQKIESPQNLIRITSSSGVTFDVTSDHELLVSEEEGYKMKEAQLLKKGEYLVKSLKMPLAYYNPTISDLLDDDYLICQENIKNACKKAFISRFGSIRGMYRNLKLDRKAFLSKSHHAITIRHLKLSGIYNQVKKDINMFKTQKGSIIKIDELNDDILYLIGLIASDGNNTKEKRTVRRTRIKFHNSNEELIDKFLNIYKNIFPNIPISKIKIKPNLFQLDTSNSFFATITASLGVTSPHGKSDLLPIANLNKSLIRSFLKGYFDGDGSVYYKKRLNNTLTKICLHTAHEKSANLLHKMLLNLEIPNKIFKRNVPHVKMNHMYDVTIGNILAEKKFIKEIGTNYSRKYETFKKISSLTHNAEITDNYYVGYHYKKEIKKEKSKLYKMGGNLNRILKSNCPLTRGFYRKCSQIINLPKVDECIIEKINKVEFVKKSDYVYDITVPETHNFLIETGFVSSNCSDLGEKIGGAHMLELRRIQAGLFNEVDKAYPSITLYEFDRIMEEYKKGNEEPLRKIIIPGEIVSALLPTIHIRKDVLKKLLTGSPIFKSFIEGNIPKLEENDKVCAFQGINFIGCYKYIGKEDLIAKPEFVKN